MHPSSVVRLLAMLREIHDIGDIVLDSFRHSRHKSAL